MAGQWRRALHAADLGLNSSVDKPLANWLAEAQQARRMLQSLVDWISNT